MVGLHGSRDRAWYRGQTQASAARRDSGLQGRVSLHPKAAEGEWGPGLKHRVWTDRWSQDLSWGELGHTHSGRAGDL